MDLYIILKRVLNDIGNQTTGVTIKTKKKKDLNLKD